MFGSGSSTKENSLPERQVYNKRNLEKQHLQMKYLTETGMKCKTKLFQLNMFQCVFILLMDWVSKVLLVALLI